MCNILYTYIIYIHRTDTYSMQTKSLEILDTINRLTALIYMCVCLQSKIIKIIILYNSIKEDKQMLHNIIYFLFWSIFLEKHKYHSFLKEWNFTFQRACFGGGHIFFFYWLFPGSGLLRLLGKQTNQYTTLWLECRHESSGPLSLTIQPIICLALLPSCFAHICIPESMFHYSCFLLITDLN